MAYVVMNFNTNCTKLKQSILPLDKWLEGLKEARVGTSTFLF